MEVTTNLCDGSTIHEYLSQYLEDTHEKMNCCPKHK